MPGYLAALTIILLIGTVLTRVFMLRRRGIAAMSFGKTDRTDFILPPFALFYFYLVFAHAFHFPSPTVQQFFSPGAVAWVGVFFCLAGLALMLWGLVSFGQSFRVGIDAEHPDRLVTSGVFAVSRNPLYVAFALVLWGQFLVFPNWILLLYFAAALWLFNRQVLREEDYLKKHYGQDFLDYCRRVRRYL